MSATYPPSAWHLKLCLWRSSVSLRGNPCQLRTAACGAWSLCRSEGPVSLPSPASLNTDPCRCPQHRTRTHCPLPPLSQAWSVSPQGEPPSGPQWPRHTFQTLDTHCPTVNLGHPKSHMSGRPFEERRCKKLEFKGRIKRRKTAETWA